MNEEQIGISEEQIKVVDTIIKIDKIKIKSYYHKKHTEASKYYFGKLDTKISHSNRAIQYLTTEDNYQKRMIAYGYSEKKVQEFAKIQINAAQSIFEQNRLLAEKTGASCEYKKQIKKAVTDFRFIVKIAKIALRNELKKGEQLKLYTARGKSIIDTFAFMENFYVQTIADSQIQTQLAIYGYSLERILSCQESYLSAKAAYQKYGIACTESNEATRIQKQRIAELDKWMSEYYALAKIAAEYSIANDHNDLPD